MRITEAQRQETESVLDRLLTITDLSKFSQRDHQQVARVCALYREPVAGHSRVRSDIGIAKKPPVQADVELDAGA